ncbi:MAG: aspartyl protease family protein, partial [Gemmataceae bacterium]
MLNKRGILALGGFLASLAVLGAIASAGSIRAREALVGIGPAVEVPYRLTLSKHVVVRARINGKGPFNFVLDTGAPALFITEQVAERSGVKQGDDGWGVCDTLELEGGLKVPKAKARIATPFQLEGMNGMGLAGVEIWHVGYNILAQYRITFDMTSDRLVWRKIDWEPKSPFGIVAKEDSSGPGGLEIIGGMMKGLGGILGRKANPTLVARGYAGVVLDEVAEGKPAKLNVVLQASPAEKAGLKVGDLIREVEGATVADGPAVLANLAQLKA